MFALRLYWRSAACVVLECSVTIGQLPQLWGARYDSCRFSGGAAILGAAVSTEWGSVAVLCLVRRLAVTDAKHRPGWQSRRSIQGSRFGVPGITSLDAFGEQALAAALTPASQAGASAFGPHAGAKSMLAFARAFGRLKCAFHNTIQPSAAGAVC